MINRCLHQNPTTRCQSNKKKWRRGQFVKQTQFKKHPAARQAAIPPLRPQSTSNSHTTRRLNHKPLQKTTFIATAKVEVVEKTLSSSQQPMRFTSIDELAEFYVAQMQQKRAAAERKAIVDLVKSLGNIDQPLHSHGHKNSQNTAAVALLAANTRPDQDVTCLTQEMDRTSSSSVLKPQPLSCLYRPSTDPQTNANLPPQKGQLLKDNVFTSEAWCPRPHGPSSQLGREVVF